MGVPLSHKNELCEHMGDQQAAGSKRKATVKKKATETSKKKRPNVTKELHGFAMQCLDP